MNTLRQFTYRTTRRITTKRSQQPLCTTMYHSNRLLQRYSSPFTRQQRITLLNRNPRPTFLASRKFSSVFGASVIGTFIKTSLIFYAIPISAAASPYFNTLPLDVIYGAVLPYHAYVGMSHIFTDYMPAQVWIAYVIGIVMFVGLQNLNFQGEGISPMVRRVFVREKLPTSKEEIKKINWLNRMQ